MLPRVSPNESLSMMRPGARGAYRSQSQYTQSVTRGRWLARDWWRTSEASRNTTYASRSDRPKVTGETTVPHPHSPPCARHPTTGPYLSRSTRRKPAPFTPLTQMPRHSRWPQYVPRRVAWYVGDNSEMADSVKPFVGVDKNG
jgi:hypothetical protein